VGSVLSCLVPMSHWPVHGLCSLAGYSQTLGTHEPSPGLLPCLLLLYLHAPVAAVTDCCPDACVQIALIHVIVSRYLY